MDCNPPGSSVRGIYRQECWSGSSFPSPEDLPDPGIKPMSPVLACRFFTTKPPGKPVPVSMRSQRVRHKLATEKHQLVETAFQVFGSGKKEVTKDEIACSVGGCLDTGQC